MDVKVLFIVILLLSGCATSREWTEKEKWLLVGSCTATIADMTTTMENLDNGGWEINPIMGRHPSNERLVITMTGMQAIVVILAHYFEQFREQILAGKMTINAGFALHNSRVMD